MAAADRGGEELHGLLGELLSFGNPLGGGQGASLLLMVFALLTVELSPLCLVAGLQEGLARWRAHPVDLTPGARRFRHVYVTLAPFLEAEHAYEVGVG
jgi:hypothetical protein